MAFFFEARQTAKCDMEGVWQALLQAESSRAVVQHHQTLLTAFLFAARRTAKCDMDGVWQALLQAESPRDIVDRKVPGVDAMQAARDEVTAEVNRCARTPPKFSADGECSVITH